MYKLLLVVDDDNGNRVALPFLWGAVPEIGSGFDAPLPKSEECYDLGTVEDVRHMPEEGFISVDLTPPVPIARLVEEGWTELTRKEEFVSSESQDWRWELLPFQKSCIFRGD